MRYTDTDGALPNMEFATATLPASESENSASDQKGAADDVMPNSPAGLQVSSTVASCGLTGQPLTLHNLL